MSNISYKNGKSKGKLKLAQFKIKIGPVIILSVLSGLFEHRSEVPDCYQDHE